MSVLFWRLAVILGLFFLSAFLISATGKSFIGVVPFFMAIVVWTLQLGFRRALFIILPFLFFADILWDNTLGPLMLFGFTLTSGLTFVATRIEAQSQFIQMLLSLIFVTFFSSIVVIYPLLTQSLYVFVANQSSIWSILVWNGLCALVVYFPIQRIILRTETFLDTSYHDQMRKIR